MEVPLELEFHHLEPSDDIKQLIREKTRKLEQVCDHCTSCRVVVEKPQDHQQSGNVFRVRIEVNVPPGHKIIADKGLTEEEMHRPLATVVRDAFKVARRQLKELNEQQRAETKSHPQQAVTAIVDKKFDDYGFLKTFDGHDVYFHRNSVVNNEFDRCTEGTGVYHVEEEGDKGPQASTVHIVDKPGERRNKV